MTEPNEVCSALEAVGIFPDLTRDELMPFCERAVQWLTINLKEDADSNSFLCLKTAEAVARYNAFTSLASKNRAYSSFKVGDVTLNGDASKELEIEKELYNRAICEAAEILKDGGFYFAAC